MPRIEVVVGDIAAQDTDALVNAANSSLMGGGGVDGALLRAGGDEQRAARAALRAARWPDGMPAGEADWTIAGGTLRANYVIHTVGPMYTGFAGDATILRSCYAQSLAVADELGVKSVTFPSISTGAYGYPEEEASAIMAEVLMNTPTQVELIRIAVLDADLAEIVRHALGHPLSN